jgi:hypothetical protein
MTAIRKLALAACATAMAPAMAIAAPGVTPGQWQIAVTINSADMPGAPPAVAKMMVGRTTNIKHCITPEDAARGPQDMLKTDKSCTFTKYSMVGGKMNSEMTCTRGGTTTTAVSSGTFTPTSFTANGRSTVSGQMPVTMTMTTVGKRLGDCK